MEYVGSMPLQIKRPLPLPHVAMARISSRSALLPMETVDTDMRDSLMASRSVSKSASSVRPSDRTRMCFLVAFVFLSIRYASSSAGYRLVPPPSFNRERLSAISRRAVARVGGTICLDSVPVGCAKKLCSLAVTSYSWGETMFFAVAPAPIARADHVLLYILSIVK